MSEDALYHLIPSECQSVALLLQTVSSPESSFHEPDVEAGLQSGTGADLHPGERG